MQSNKKVIWHEGMTLDPHHFQQSDRYFVSLLDFRIRSISNLHWGLVGLTIDKESLTNGQFKLLNCKGVMPDGLAFQLPEVDPLPLAAVIDEGVFPATDESLSVYFVIPIEREHGSNCLLSAEQDGVETRFRLETLSLKDDNTGRDEREVGVGRANFQLKLGNELLEDYSSLKIAEVTRTSAGAFELNTQFVPTCLSMAASDYLVNLVRELTERLITERSLKWQQRPHPSSQNAFTTSDAHVLGYLNIINYYIPFLNHEYTQKQCHPETLYKTLLLLAGQLTTFSTAAEIHPRDFPPYDHNNLTACFNRLDAIIRNLLSLETPEHYTSIPLEKHGESLYMGDLEESCLAHSALLLLMIRNDNNDVLDSKIIDELPGNIKIADKERIDKLTASASNGLAVRHVSRPPVGLPSEPSVHYFQLEKAGTFWDIICQKKNIALRLLGSFSSVNLELVVVLSKQ